MVKARKILHHRAVQLLQSRTLLPPEGAYINNYMFMNAGRHNHSTTSGRKTLRTAYSNKIRERRSKWLEHVLGMKDGSWKNHQKSLSVGKDH